MFVLFLSELCSRAAELFSPIPFEAPPQQSWGVSPVAAKLLPPDALNDVWVFILISTVVMYVATVLLWLLCREGEKSGPTRLQKAYRVFNFLINTCFGVFGYYVHYVVTGPNTNVDLMVNRISAPHPLAVHLSHLQFAYQLWSIPVGLVVGEVPLMYFHHVLVAGLAWAVMRNEVDFLYYQCYYFGITELSSIPLAVMNFFKDSKALREKYPTVYSVVRIVFAFAFLYFRGVLLYFFTVRFYADSLFVLSNAQDTHTKLHVAWLVIGLGLMVVMQLYWMQLILKGLAKTVLGAFGGKKMKKK